MKNADVHETETIAFIAEDFTEALAGDLGRQLVDWAVDALLQRLDGLESTRREELEQQATLQKRLAVVLDAMVKEDVAEHWRLIEEVQAMKNELTRVSEEQTGVSRQLREIIAQRDAATIRADTMAEQSEMAERELAVVRGEQEALRRRAAAFEDRLATCEEARLADRNTLEILQRERDELAHRLAELQVSWERLGS